MIEFIVGDPSAPPVIGLLITLHHWPPHYPLSSASSLPSVIDLLIPHYPARCLVPAGNIIRMFERRGAVLSGGDLDILEDSVFEAYLA